MNLQNGYKVIYEKAADGKRTFYASKTGVFADAEIIAEAEIGKYKLIYEKAGRFYGSESGIPSEGDYCFEDFDKVFIAAEATEEVGGEPQMVVDEDPVIVVEDEPEQVTGSDDVVEEDEIEE
jgi:hypothetical protein